MLRLFANARRADCADMALQVFFFFLSLPPPNLPPSFDLFFQTDHRWCLCNIDIVPVLVFVPIPVLVLFFFPDFVPVIVLVLVLVLVGWW